jgi:hypothetical protein
MANPENLLLPIKVPQKYRAKISQSTSDVHFVKLLSYGAFRMETQATKVKHAPPPQENRPKTFKNHTKNHLGTPL